MKSVQVNPEEKKTKSVLHIAVAAICSLMLAVATIGCSAPASNDEGNNASSGSGQEAPAEDTISVNLTIDCSAAVEAGNETAIAVSEDGKIFDGTVELEEGASIYDAIVASGIDFTNTESSMGSYISAINGLASGDEGEMSGWVYTLNGEDVMVSASEQTLKDGDSVEWVYVLTFE